MVEQARKSRAKQRYKRPVSVEPIELVVCHALNENQITLQLMSHLAVVRKGDLRPKATAPLRTPRRRSKAF